MTYHQSCSISNIVIIRHLEVLIFYFRSPCAFKMSYSKGKCFKKTFKNAQKTHFSEKVILRYFQKYVRYGSNVFWGPKHIPWAHSEAITRPPTFSTAKTPSPLVNSCLFWRFFELFLPTAWARPKISQH